MTVNVEALLRSIGMTYQDIFEKGLIPYKTKPTGDSGDPVLELDMVKEGVYLAFHRISRKLFCVTLTLLDEDKPSMRFPNELPSPLQKEMSLSWMHEQFDAPDKSVPPKIIGGLQFGMKERYTLEGFHIPLSMQVAYTANHLVESLTFMPLAGTSW
ncbi:pyocin immunity protein [Citrobacter braakii]|jgi:hypothetical protein|nr:pyocin immunity protein [Citrobacter braakii]